MRDPLPASASIEPEASTTASMADGTLSWLHEKTASAIALAAGGRRAASPSRPVRRSPSSEISSAPPRPRGARRAPAPGHRDPGAASAATMRGKSRTGAPTAGVRSRRSARPVTVCSCCSVATTSRGERRANMAGWTVASSPATVRAPCAWRTGPGAGGRRPGSGPPRGPRPPARSPRGRPRRTTPGWARTPVRRLGVAPRREAPRRVATHEDHGRPGPGSSPAASSGGPTEEGLGGHEVRLRDPDVRQPAAQRRAAATSMPDRSAGSTCTQSGVTSARAATTTLYISGATTRSTLRNSAHPSAEAAVPPSSRDRRTTSRPRRRPALSPAPRPPARRSTSSGAAGSALVVALHRVPPRSLR